MSNVLKFFLIFIAIFSLALSPSIAFADIESKYKPIFGEYFSLVNLHVENKNIAKIEELSQEFVNRHKDLNIAEIYIWNTELKTENNLLFKKTYLGANTSIVYAKIRYANPRKINISEKEHEKQKYILIEQQFVSDKISYRMVIFIND